MGNWYGNSENSEDGRVSPLRPNSKYFAIILAAILLCFASPVHAQKADAKKLMSVQAGFIYHLAELVTWPENRFENADSPIVVGFVGTDTKQIADYFEAQAPRYTAQERKLVVRRFSTFDRRSLQELRKCHIVYISLPDRGRVRLLVEFFNSIGVLSVGGTEDFADIGGMVSFYADRTNMKIKVNLRSVQQSNLKISAQLLQHATIVK